MTMIIKKIRDIARPDSILYLGVPVDVLKTRARSANPQTSRIVRGARFFASFGVLNWD